MTPRRVISAFCYDIYSSFRFEYLHENEPIIEKHLAHVNQKPKWVNSENTYVGRNLGTLTL